MTDNRYENLDQLGRETALPSSPDDAVLDRVANPCDAPYMIRFACPEFTSLCPVTGAPDFAHLVIDYVPRDWIVESKSLKLFLGAFRNHGAFHEDLDPVWLRIGGYWYPRGGIPIDVFFATGDAPEGVWIPEQDVANYRGRG
jgi:7-cyano-7-deazaguanine reductase